MITSILKKAALGLAAAGALTALMSTTSNVGGIKAGDQVSYTWNTPLVNGMGVTSLEDMLGTPVLVEFWGTR
ncbi:MAG: outer membrane protein assembly factor BamE (lipoprotein component of BamABCDE complex) [Bacteroidia bacterium]|jgi:outer membrane protein assembly factor BamE (lipoprotein component of BamABCDE complex)